MGAAGTAAGEMVRVRSVARVLQAHRDPAGPAAKDVGDSDPLLGGMVVARYERADPLMAVQRGG